MAALRDLIGGLLYPRGAVCIACGRMRVDVAAWCLCADCAQALEMQVAAVPLHGLDACACAFNYEGTARRLVRAMKYNCVVAAADALADGMAQAVPASRYDALVPVPLYRTRQRQRGFNQAAVLCEALSGRLDLPVLHALARNRSTQTQTRLTAAERRQNVQGAFAACAPVDGMSLLLVDDVLTTGSTAMACAQALRGAGAARVSLLAAAYAVVHADV